MCGIIGIISSKEVSSRIINSLKKLEYRGYDSAGIATLVDGNINEVKCEGRVDVLEIIFKDRNDLMIGARRGSPLAVGYGPKENYLGSDSYALKSMTNKISYLDDEEFCIIKKDQIDFFQKNGVKINKKVMNLSKEETGYLAKSNNSLKSSSSS